MNDAAFDAIETRRLDDRPWGRDMAARAWSRTAEDVAALDRWNDQRVHSRQRREDLRDNAAATSERAKW